MERPEKRPWQIAHVVGKDKRKAIRRRIPVPAMIYSHDGRPIVGCTVRDISATGAQVLLARPMALPAEFVLALSNNTQVRRNCILVWQNAISVGASFVLELDQSLPTSPPR
jgi:PilZ domain-containing protein